MSNELKPVTSQEAKMEAVLVQGDLAKLSESERVSYYNRVCDSVGLNPLTRPFEYITLNSKLTLYARRDATDQLRKIHRVSVRILSREKDGEIYTVTAQARMPDGREDESTGAVFLGRVSGEALANLYLKAETKAKRRVTLSICGLGFLDETEVETIPQAKRFVDTVVPPRQAIAHVGPVVTGLVPPPYGERETFHINKPMATQADALRSQQATVGNVNERLANACATPRAMENEIKASIKASLSHIPSGSPQAVVTAFNSHAAGDYVIKSGSRTGQKLRDIPTTELKPYLYTLEANVNDSTPPVKEKMLEIIGAVKDYLG